MSDDVWTFEVVHRKSRFGVFKDIVARNQKGDELRQDLNLARVDGNILVLKGDKKIKLSDQEVQKFKEEKSQAFKGTFYNSNSSSLSTTLLSKKRVTAAQENDSPSPNKPSQPSSQIPKQEFLRSPTKFKLAEFVYQRRTPASIFVPPSPTTLKSSHESPKSKFYAEQDVPTNEWGGYKSPSSSNRKRESHFEEADIVKKPNTLEVVENIPPDSMTVSSVPTAIPVLKTNRLGFRNTGLSCYCNSTIQALVTCDILKKEVLSNFWQEWLKGKEKTSYPVFSGLRQMFLDPNANPSDIIKPFMGKFAATNQEDAHEFFLALLSSIETELVGDSHNQSLPSVKSRIKELVAFTKERFTTWDDASISDEEKIRAILPHTRIFGATLCKTVTCTSCLFERKYLEKFCAHSLDFPSTESRVVKLEELLHCYLPNNDVVDLNCEKCETGKTSTIQTTFVQLPRILILHLKRFTNRGGETDKRKDVVLAPKLLNLSSLVGSDQYIWKVPEITQSVTDASFYKGNYRLTAVVMHTGSRASGGHYKTACLVTQEDDWVMFDDEYVTSLESDWLDKLEYQKGGFMYAYTLIENE